MVSLSLIVRKGFAAAAALIVLPVIGEYAVEVARAMGFYENPTGRLQSLVGYLAAVTQHPWYPVVAALAVGLFVGSWFDRIARRSDYKRPSKALISRAIGERAVYMATRIEEHLSYGGFDPSDSLARIIPDVMSLIFDFKKAGLPGPSKFPGWDNPLDAIKHVGLFFRAVGPLLRDGHTEEAIRAAGHY